jgi:predicted dehydrogenase/threonine dehydrogenase-like Zn-dependent dehydrogenase
MKQVLIRQGIAVVEEVPAPLVEPGTVLVRVARSCISIGTELSGMRASGTSLLQRARREPQRVKTLARMVVTDGLSRTRKRIEAKLGAGNATGYSAAGTIIAVGEGIDDLMVGTRVACAGAQCAHHAEVICVPRHLAVPLPAGLDFESASTVTLGAIALQGVRRACPTLGETFVVVGLGVLGQLTAQLLRANGARVIGLDLHEDRLQLAADLALEATVQPGRDVEFERVARLTDGFGADGVIVTAASSSSEILSTAFRMCRRKARVVLVGDVGLDLKREDIYLKELDFLVSTSYGPGRYDPTYEEGGLDYPIAYVRWTENRNMAEYVRLLGTGRLQVQRMVSAVYPVDEAPAAYRALNEGPAKPLMVLLAYPDREERLVQARLVPLTALRSEAGRRVRLALAGAGDFATGVHLPNIHALRDRIDLRCIQSRTGAKAAEVGRQYGATYATTDFGEVLADPEVDAVLIATRHDLHAGMALAALSAGKHVLVEKPLALLDADLDAIETFYAERQGQAVPLLLTGFNRRFSPHARAISTVLSSRTNPMVIQYFMNAGYIPASHWVHGPEGGGRNRGEACHIYDLFTFLTGARLVGAEACALRPATGHYLRSDNFIATVTLDDGSVATLTYTSLGNASYPKETMVVACDGKVLELKDYQHLVVAGERPSSKNARFPDKGLRAELEAFVDAVRGGGPWPIPLWQQLQASRIANLVEAALRPTTLSFQTRTP